MPDRTDRVRTTRLDTRLDTIQTHVREHGGLLDDILYKVEWLQNRTEWLPITRYLHTVLLVLILWRVW